MFSKDDTRLYSGRPNMDIPVFDTDFQFKTKTQEKFYLLMDLDVYTGTLLHRALKSL